MFVKKILAQAALVLTVLATGLEAQTRNVFVLPAGANNPVLVYNNDSFSPTGNFGSAPAPFLVLANAQATKYYVISKSPTNTVTVIDGGNYTTLVNGRFNFGANAEAAAITPDGRRLLVLAGTLHIIDTATDTDLTPAGVGVGFAPNDLAISHDSSRAFVLSKSSAVVTAVNLTTGAATGQTYSVLGVNSTVSVAPNGLLYVTATNRVYELDPKTMQVRTEIPLNAIPGKPVYTPDGKYALFTNQIPVTGSAVILLSLGTHQIAATIAGNLGITFDKLLIASNSLAYGTSPSNGKIYAMTIPALGGNEASFGNGPISGVVTATLSNEVEPRVLYVASNSAIYRIDVAAGSSAVPSQYGLPAPPSDLDFAGPATSGTPSQVLLYNNNQTAAAGAVFSTPFVVRIVDSLGRPVANAPVTFASSDTGASIQTPNATTSNDGFAQTTITASNTPGQFTMSVTAGSTSTATGSFTLTVSGGSTTGGGPSGGTTGGGTTVAPLSILSGNGQLIREQIAAPDLMAVVVRDAAGKPVPGATVTFAITQGLGVLQGLSGSGATLGVCTATDQTAVCSADANGQAGIGFHATSSSNFAFAPTTVTATYNTNTINFVETTFLSYNQNGFQPDPAVVDVVPPFGSERAFTVQAGQTLAGAIQTHVYSIATGTSFGSAFDIPNVSLTVSTGQDPAVGPTASCNGPGGAALSDANGIATCDLIAGGRIGTVPLNITVGSTNSRPSGTLTITAGPPGLLNLIQGNNQSGIAGQRLPLALVAQVTDAFGNILPGVAVTFEVVTPGSLTLSNVFGTSDSTGKVSALVTLGSVPGAQQVRVKTGNITSLFTVTVNVTFGAITPVSGSGQTAVINQPFTQPLIARVTDNKGATLANTDVTFAVTGGSATLSGTTAKTDASGYASISATAGSTAGPITVTATVGNFVATFNLTSRLPGPSLTIAGFRNGASFFSGVAPGGIVSIFGAGIAPTVQGVVIPGTPVGQLPTSLAGVDVTFNGLQAPIFSVSNVAGTEQVTVQVPFDLPAGQANVTVRVNGGSSSISNVPISALQPGIFETTDTNARKYAVATRPDGSFVSTSNPARKGESVRVYLTGLGQVSPATATNRAGIAGQNVLAPIIIGVNNAGVPGGTAEYMPGMIGVYMITFNIPADAPAGSSIPLAFAATGSDGNNNYSNTSNIAIQ